MKKEQKYSFKSWDRIYIALKRAKEREKKTKKRISALWALYKNVK